LNLNQANAKLNFIQAKPIILRNKSASGVFSTSVFRLIIASVIGGLPNQVEFATRPYRRTTDDQPRSRPPATALWGARVRAASLPPSYMMALAATRRDDAACRMLDADLVGTGPHACSPLFDRLDMFSLISELLTPKALAPGPPPLVAGRLSFVLLDPRGFG
jgi:hypothetical protein